jgi:hypothetical protein
MKHGLCAWLILSLCAGSVVQGELQWHALGTPAARRSATMIVDSVNQRIVLFGGSSERANGKYYNDVWQMPLEGEGNYGWAPLSVAGDKPAGRTWHSAAYDPVHQKMYVIGGVNSSGTLTDVWALDLTAGSEEWQQLRIANTPSPTRCATHPIYHPRRNSLICFGGSGNYEWFNDVWELKLDSMVWREIPIRGEKPGDRGSAGMFFDQSGNRMIIFGGGMGGHFYNDLWALDLTPGSEHWTELEPTGEIPGARNGFAFGYNPKSQKLYISCGSSLEGHLYNDVYVLRMRTMTWVQRHPSGDVLDVRRNTVGTFDRLGRTFFVFGGDIGSSYFGDTHFLPFGEDDDDELPDLTFQSVSSSAPSVRVSSVSSDQVRLHFALPEAGHVDVKILDVTGRLVRHLFSGTAPAANAEFVWDRIDDSGKAVSRGTYCCLLEAGPSRIVGCKFVLSR